MVAVKFVIGKPCNALKKLNKADVPIIIKYDHLIELSFTGHSKLSIFQFELFLKISSLFIAFTSCKLCCQINDSPVK
nr:hypothetical protein [Streptococcus gallolyticus]